ncbi:hypothetical protein PPERSA_00852 [Pseudocohnilembus persalinus]|uniref:Uncharacterized protein n=1 Tax=Pseudocohnilembus persalinus TaxID=266149 RepID=A0A0V0QEI0_PSEPJ|nr:hypothetical protein PPERSA_00852 [Pseudocohnilembus persalinus]|eukprot:KRX00625.1 hypothetical protein PPERSA_00852 [Pseudocohnilembus persalinus]
MKHLQQNQQELNEIQDNNQWIRDEDLEARNFRSFGQLFWQKIKEELRMEILQENKPRQILKLYEISPEDININLQEVKKWSIQNEILYNQLLENGFADFICNKQNLKEIYEELVFNDENITEMDQELKKLVNLQILRLTKNFIKRVENIPQKLRELYLFQNQISIISPKIQSENLVYLGLGYNKLSDEAIQTIGYQLPNLLCLDLCYNDLCMIDILIESLQILKQLKMLTTYGNPISLLPNYHKAMVHAFPQLVFFDEVKIGKLNEGKQSIGFYLDDELNKKPNIEDKNQIDLDAKIDFDKFNQQMGQLITQFNVKFQALQLENPEGVILDKDNYNEELIRDNPLRFSTHFWIQLCIDKQNVIKSEKISLELQFKDENEKSRIDFKFQQNEIFQIDSISRDLIRRGFLVKLFKSEPVLQLNPETEENEPVLDEQNLPKINDNILIGICRLETKNWLKDTSSERHIQQKFKLFSGDLERVPEFYVPLDNELQLVKQNGEKIQQMIKEREEKMKPVEPEEINDPKGAKNKKDTKKAAKKKETKKEPKKDTKKKGGKNQQDQEEDSSIKLLDWPLNEREIIIDSENNIYLNIYEPYLLALEAQLI